MLTKTDTFAFQTDGPAVAGQSAAAAQAEMGTIGSGVQDRTQIDAPKAGEDAGVFFKLAGKLLEPLVKQEQEVQFYEGVAKAAAGEAAKDIAAGRSFVSTLYGPNHVELGARAYEAQNDAAMLTGKIYEALPTLNQMPTQQASQEIRKLVDLHKPKDDPLRAQLYEAQALKEVPGILKTQARSYAEYLQVKANNAHASRTLSMMDAFESQSLTVESPDDRARLVNSLADIVDIMPGQDPTRAMQNVGTALIAQARQGKFAAFNHMKDLKILDALPPDLRAQVENAVDIEARTLAPTSRTTEETVELHDLLRNGYKLSDEEFLTRINDFNQKVRDRNRIPADTFPVGNNLGALARNAQEREQQARAGAAMTKARSEALDEQMMVTQMAALAQEALTSKKWLGNEQALIDVNLTGTKKRSTFDAFVATAWVKADPQTKAQFLENGQVFVAPSVEKWVNAHLQPNSEFNAGIEQVAAVARYFPDNYQSKLGLSSRQDTLLTDYMRAIASNPNDKAAAWTYASARARATEFETGVQSKDREAAQAVVTDKLDGIFSSPTQLNFLGSRVAAEMRLLSPNMDPADRAEYAYNKALRGLELHGDIAVLRNRDDQESAYELMTKYSAAYNLGVVLPADTGITKGILGAFKAKAKAGEDISNWTFLRGADETRDGPNGKKVKLPVYYGYAPDLRVVTVTGMDILQYANQSPAAKAARTQTRTRSTATPAWQLPQYN